MKRFFITGTDTDCGKTYVTSQLTKLIESSLAIKPIASGCTELDGQLINSDALIYQQQSKLSMDLVNPWRFKLPVSPHLASGYRLDIQAIVSYCLNFNTANIQTLFIEGAGGLMAPLNESCTWVDFLKMAKIPVILVVGMKLGCLNHALLTQSTMQSNQLECVGWVANCIDPDMLMIDENIETLKRMLKYPLLGIVGYGKGIENLDFACNVARIRPQP